MKEPDPNLEKEKKLKPNKFLKPFKVLNIIIILNNYYMKLVIVESPAKCKKIEPI